MPAHESPPRKRARREAAPAIAAVPGDAFALALDYMDSGTLLACTLVCARWVALMCDLGRAEVRDAERSWRPVVPARASRPRFVPVERFYRLQYLGSKGVWCPRPGRAAVPEAGAARASWVVPFPLALPAPCSWDKARQALRGVDPGVQATVSVGKKALAVTTGGPLCALHARYHVREAARVASFGDAVVARFEELMGPHAPVPRPKLVRVGPWVVSMPCRPALLAVHAVRLDPCCSAGWTRGKLLVETPGPKDGPLRIDGVSPSCAMVSELRAALWVPLLVLWCSPRSGTDELVVRTVLPPPHSAPVQWELAPFDFEPDGAVLLVRD